MKEKLKKIVNSKYFPFLALFIVMFLLHLTITLGTDDDVWFKTAINDADNGSSMITYLKNRYNGWTSRILIEPVLITLLQLPSIVWILIDCSMMVLIAYSISKLFKIDNRWILVILILTYPFIDMRNAGWYATTLNYLWPLALGLFSLIPIRNVIDEKKEKWYMYPLYVISLLFGCNQEQTCAVIFAFYLIFTIYFIIKKEKKLKPFIVIQLLLSVFSLIFILTCPGNNARNVTEVSNWYPAYESFGILTKIFLGVISTFEWLVFDLNPVMLILTVILPVFVFKKNKNIIVRFISLIPALITSGFTIFLDPVSKVFPQIGKTIEASKLYLSSPSDVTLGVTSIFIFGACLVFFLSILFSIYKVFDEKEDKYIMCLVFLAGIASKFIMGFSAVLYVSSIRTFIVLDFSIIIILAYMLNKEKKLNNCYYLSLGVFAILQLANTALMHDLHI